MPLLLITGHPSSGKSTIVERLVTYFGEKGKEAFVIVDEDNSVFNRSVYQHPQKEKDHRSFIRSLVQKQLGKNVIVICDGLNYIKGFRYELFLTGKLSKTTYAVLQCTADQSTCSWLDSQKPAENRYGDELLKALIVRYEKPISKNRWDSPLFEIKVGKAERELSEEAMDDMNFDLEHPSPQFADVPFDDIYKWLCEGIPLTENQSTQVVPLAPTNFLHELDRTTQEVVNTVIQGQRDGVIGQPIVVASAEESNNKINFSKIRSLAELSRLRRQFISFTKTHPVENTKKIASLFVNFLNTTNLS